MAAEGTGQKHRRAYPRGTQTHRTSQPEAPAARGRREVLLTLIAAAGGQVGSANARARTHVALAILPSNTRDAGADDLCSRNVRKIWLQPYTQRVEVHPKGVE